MALINTGTTGNKTNPVTSEKAFFSQWKQPDHLDGLIGGYEGLHDINTRQRYLVDKIADTCILLHIFEKLKAGTPVDELALFFNGQPSLEQRHKLETGTNKERMSLLVEMSQLTKPPMLRAELVPVVYKQLKDGEIPIDYIVKSYFNFKPSPLQRGILEKGSPSIVRALLKQMTLKPFQPVTIRLHRDLTGSDAWEKHWEIAEKNLKYKNEYTSKALAHIERTGEPYVIRQKPEHDPWAAILNAKIGETIAMVDPGPKEKESIQLKAEKRLRTKYSTITDVNRAGVLPTMPEYAEDFCKLMTILNPPKKIWESNAKYKKITKYFERIPTVFANAYYDQKLYLMLDVPLLQDTHNAAVNGEIKIVPASMDKACELSAIIKPIQDTLSIYTSKDAETLTEAEVKMVRISYLLRLPEYEMLAKTLHMQKYKLPPLPTDNAMSSYRKLFDDFQNLALSIHTDAIKSENVEWAEKYMHALILQRVSRRYSEHLKEGARKRLSYNERQLRDTKPLSEDWESRIIQELAEKTGIDPQKMEGEIVYKLNRENAFLQARQ